MPLTSMRPPRIAQSLTIGAAAVHWALYPSRPLRLFLPQAGALVAIAGFTLMMWAWLVFKNQQLAVCVQEPTARITRSGPYRFSRNPMYLGMFLMMLGPALAVGTIPFFLSAIIWFGIVNYAFCPYEEQKLTKHFGSQYEHYKNAVRRWV